MLELDPRTVIFVNFIYTFCVSVFIISAVLLEKYRFKGFGSWIAAFLLLSGNFLILSLRSIIPVRFVIIVPHLLAVWAYVEIKRGLARFYNIRNRVYTDGLIVLVLTIALVMNPSNARLRIVTICIASILVYLDTLVLLSSRRGREAVTSRAIYLLYAIAVLVMVIRLLLGLRWDPRGNPMDTGNCLSAISILFFVTNIVIFFSLLFIVLNRILDERSSLIEKIRSISFTDELTGLLNRRGFKNVTKYEKNRFARTNQGFTFVICDIDHFKRVNDHDGHECGDSVLRDTGTILQRNMRNTDTAARWGGDEFVLLLPETNIEQAKIVQERIRSEVERCSFVSKQARMHLTMSFGACYCDNPDVEIDAIIDRADSNLYAAKDGGRNRIVISAY